VPSRAARFGIISDLDDTVVRSDVRRRIRMALSVALSNAHTRKPFEGVAAFYRALTHDHNPIFYVSNSPWNLYHLLLEFLTLQAIPLGPVILRDYGPRRLLRPVDHKRTQIEAILATYPHLPFVLIGDSGERDPEIYAEVVRRHLNRVTTVYIRSIDEHPKRVAGLQRVIDELRTLGCEMVLVPDSKFAAEHAARTGLIQAASLPSIEADNVLDRGLGRSGSRVVD
jgi:phosphatidate phosphatase APP1